MDGILNWKKCKRCGKFFDIDTSQDLCSECRNKKEVENGGKKREERNATLW